jgi:hypothetical protein
LTEYIYTNSVDGFPLLSNYIDIKQYEGVGVERIDEIISRKKTDTIDGKKRVSRGAEDLLPKYYVEFEPFLNRFFGSNTIGVSPQLGKMDLGALHRTR